MPIPATKRPRSEVFSPSKTVLEMEVEPDGYENALDSMRVGLHIRIVIPRRLALYMAARHLPVLIDLSRL